MRIGSSLPELARPIQDHESSLTEPPSSVVAQVQSVKLKLVY